MFSQRNFFVYITKHLLFDSLFLKGNVFVYFTKHFLLDSYFFKGNVFVYLTKHLLLDSLFSQRRWFLATWSIWMIHLDSMDDYMFFSNDISFEFYDHMLLFMISSLSSFDHIILAMVIPLSFSWSIYFFPMIFDLSKSLILDIL